MLCADGPACCQRKLTDIKRSADFRHELYTPPRIDGVKQKEATAELGTGHDYLYVGANPSYGENFIGDIDEVRVYDQILSEAQLQSLDYWFGYKLDPVGE